ncbi:hypothetical protein LCGC14_1802470 [marine sediment metagenome]|uniref:Uncharacterized protein n=1 Tax=marine sediment metagenome TaxID=412755 RepID=A0A0F9GPA2_9ZZZZ
MLGKGRPRRETAYPCKHMPGRKHKARGMCVRCYNAWLRRQLTVRRRIKRDGGLAQQRTITPGRHIELWTWRVSLCVRPCRSEVWAVEVDGDRVLGAFGPFPLFPLGKAPTWERVRSGGTFSMCVPDGWRQGGRSRWRELTVNDLLLRDEWVTETLERRWNEFGRVAA